jgi:hypothetical protein
VQRGDISQMSFGFRVGKHEIEEDEEKGIVKRTITEFSDLYDVSPVTFPAYEGTDAGMRAARSPSSAMPCSRAPICRDVREALAALKIFPRRHPPRRSASRHPSRVAFRSRAHGSCSPSSA